MTVREMRDRLFHIDDQTVAVRRVLPAYAKYTASPNETVEQMRHRLFNLEPQDGPIEKAKDVTDRRARDVQKFEVVSKGGSIGSKGPSIMGEHDTLFQAREHAKRLTKQLTPGERKYYGMGYIVRPKKSVGATDRRTRLHAALDAVMDGKKRAKDAGGAFGGTEVFQLRDGWRVIFKGAVAKGTWADKGAAEAQLDLLKKGYSALTAGGDIKHIGAKAKDAVMDGPRKVDPDADFHFPKGRITLHANKVGTKFQIKQGREILWEGLNRVEAMRELKFLRARLEPKIRYVEDGAVPRESPAKDALLPV